MNTSIGNQSKWPVAQTGGLVGGTCTEPVPCREPDVLRELNQLEKYTCILEEELSTLFGRISGIVRQQPKCPQEKIQNEPVQSTPIGERIASIRRKIYNFSSITKETVESIEI